MNGILRLIEEKEAALRAQYAKAELMEEALEGVHREINNLKIQIGTLKEALPLLEQEGVITNGYQKDPAPIGNGPVIYKKGRDNLQQYMKEEYKGRTYPDIIINLLVVKGAMTKGELIEEIFDVPKGMNAADFEQTLTSTLSRLKVKTGEIQYVELNGETKYTLAKEWGNQ